MRMIVLLFGLMTAACGSDPAPPPVAETTGAEAPAPAPPEPAEAEEEVVEEPPAPASGPASVTFNVMVKGEVVAAEIKLLDGSGEVVAEGKSGQSLSVTSGDYDAEVSITDAKILADLPTRNLSVSLAAGDSAVEEVVFPWANVQLNVTVNGTLDRSATVKVKRQGAVVTTVKSNGEHIMISPGRYTAEVKTRGASIEVDGLMFPEGATQGVPVAVQL